jgi:starch phosphorylase
MLHTIFEKQKHPNSPLIAITNGVYAKHWQSSLWPKDGIGVLGDAELWQVRNSLRLGLIAFVKEATGVELDAQALTIVWARRFASYKRPHLLFNDLDRLAKIVSDAKQPVQFIISGNAHEADPAGVAIIEKIQAYIAHGPLQSKIVYVPNYSINIARELVKGADVWLNTPERGVEACGTSGMKAGINGALQCSISDGWIEEVDWTNTGWVLATHDTEKSVYDTIEHEIKPLFYDRDKEHIPEQWLKRVRSTINIVTHRFTASRMIKDYVSKLYYPET